MGVHAAKCMIGLCWDEQGEKSKHVVVPVRSCVSGEGSVRRLIQVEGICQVNSNSNNNNFGEKTTITSATISSIEWHRTR